MPIRLASPPANDAAASSLSSSPSSLNLVFYMESANVIEKLKRRGAGAGRTLVPLNAKAEVVTRIAEGEDSRTRDIVTELSWDVPVLFCCKRRRKESGLTSTNASVSTLTPEEEFEITAEIATSWEEEEEEEEGGEVRLTLDSGEEAI